MIKQLQSQRGRRAYDLYSQALASIFDWANPISDNSYALEVDPYFYQKIRRDPVFAHVIDTAKRVTSGREWAVEPASERPQDVQRAKLEDAALRQIVDFTSSRFNLAEGMFRGSAHARIDGTRRLLDVEGMPPAVWWVPTHLHDVDRRRFRLGRNESGAVVWEFWSVKEYAWKELREDERAWFVSTRWRTTEDTLGYGWGLYDALAEYARAKTQLLAASLNAADRFGQGLVTVGIDRTPGEVGSDAAMKQRATDARDVIRQSRQDNVITYPKGDELDFLEPSGTGFQLLMDLLEYVDAKVLTLVLGGNLPTSANGGGSYALAAVQEASGEALGRHNRDKLAEDLTRDLLGLWGRVNAVQLRRAGLAGARPGKFQILDDQAAEDLGAFAQALETLSRVGVPVGLQEVYDRTGLNKPKAGDPITKVAADPPKPEPAPGETDSDLPGPRLTPVGEGKGGVAAGEAA